MVPIILINKNYKLNMNLSKVDSEEATNDGEVPSNFINAKRYFPVSFGIVFP